MKEKQEDSVFIRYRNGNILLIKPNIKQVVSKLVPLLEATDDHKTVFNEQIENIADGSGAGVHPDSTWIQATRELFFKYERYDGKSMRPDTKVALIEILRLLTSSYEERAYDWDEIRRFIIENLTALSPVSPERFLTFDGYEVQRDEGGNYFYEKEDGITVLVQGLKTPIEEKLQFYTNDSQMKYGRLYSLLKFIALFDIAFDYSHHRENFPDTLCCVLYDNNGDTSYISWDWSMPTPFEYIPFNWHPRSPLSNPEWLSSDLIMNMPFINGEPDSTVVPINPPENELKQWEEAFQGYGWQVELPVVSNLLIGEDNEVYFDFMDRKVRWINGNAFTQPVIVVPSKDKDGDDGIEIARKFLSLLNIENEVQLAEQLISIQAPRYLPWYRQYRMPVFKLVDPKYALPKDNPEDYSSTKWYALAFMREAASSTSIYYEFLNYFKVVELGCQGTVSEIKEFINSNAEEVCVDRGLDWYREITSSGVENAGAYLHTTGRVAIAHAEYDFKKNRVTHNPDSPDDYNRTKNDLSIMKELAKLMIGRMA